MYTMSILLELSIPYTVHLFYIKLLMVKCSSNLDQLDYLIALDLNNLSICEFEIPRMTNDEVVNLIDI